MYIIMSQSFSLSSVSHSTRTVDLILAFTPGNQTIGLGRTGVIQPATHVNYPMRSVTMVYVPAFLGYVTKRIHALLTFSVVYLLARS